MGFPCTYLDSHLLTDFCLLDLVLLELGYINTRYELINTKSFDLAHLITNATNVVGRWAFYFASFTIDQKISMFRLVTEKFKTV